ncbi:type 1 fimbrial protein [Salmonella enterica]|nr:type 1 fimbrial protein [Salmonella enterica]
MKKSMAGQGVAGALLLAGLMVSTGVMAASGDPVQGGSGTVTINVPIVTSTCSVSVPTEVNLDQLDVNKISATPLKGELETKAFDITFANCNGKPIKMTVQSHADNNVSLIDKTTGGFSSGDPDKALAYYLSLPIMPGVVTGGYNGNFSLRNDSPVMITPDSDNFIFSPILTLFYYSPVKNLGSTVSGAFDYTVTYQ